jgi:hypothetical protein
MWNNGKGFRGVFWGQGGSVVAVVFVVQFVVRCVVEGDKLW